MHTDDHILETFIASNKPLAAIAAELSITLIALVKWLDRNADLIALAKRAMETQITILSLRAEVVALMDLTSVSSSTTNEERKRKSASQLLRHTAKRLLPGLSAQLVTARAGSTEPSGANRRQRESASRISPLAPSPAAAPPSSSPPNSALQTSSESRNPNAASSLDASMPPASMPSSSSSPPRLAGSKRSFVPSSSSRLSARAGAAPPTSPPSLINMVLNAIEDLTPRSRLHAAV